MAAPSDDRDRPRPRGQQLRTSRLTCVAVIAPRVSVIIPAYNAAEYLPEALRSVEAQTTDDWEVVVCDDASSDDTADVAESFGDRVRVIRSKENAGRAGACNKALAAARGELIAFLDADDYWLPEYLEEQIALYESSEAERPGVGVVSCDALVVGPDRNVIGTFRERFPWPSRPTLSKLLAVNTIHCMALMPRSIAEEVGGFSPQCLAVEDQDLWVKVLERGYHPINNPRALVAYRQVQGSVSSDSATMARNQQIVYRLALERGRLSWRERWIARRELRLHRLVEEVREIQSERASRGRLPIGRVVRASPGAIAVGLSNPQPWARLIRGEGSLRDRFAPGRESFLRKAQ
jgi:teichuronic acid biosynthesis glycosyltransferase TuaG